MLYEHPFYKKKFETMIGETLFFNYITYKISDSQFETFIFDEDTFKMLPIEKILDNLQLTDYGAAITLNAKDTQALWERLKYIGDKQLVQQFGQFLSNDEDQNKNALEWLHLMRKKNE